MQHGENTRGGGSHIADALAAEPFVDLVTFRADGRPVSTPVWVSGARGQLFVSTFGDSGKVKRAHADPRVRMRACAGDGTPLPGSLTHEARVVDVRPAGFRAGVAAHARKYGAHFRVMWPARWLFALRGHPRVWLIIEITDP